MPTLRQIQSMLAVYEERSFTAAAARENATQSGISQHVAALEAELDVQLFARAQGGVRPTSAGARYYEGAVAALKSLAAAHSAAKEGGALAGPVDAGVMPSFTRAALAPALERVSETYPDIAVRIIEGYSGTLTEMVRAGELDFALVPAFAPDAALTMTPLARDREMLVTRPGRLVPATPVRAGDLGSLKLVVPSRANTRRAKIEEYFAAYAVRIERILEIDSMMGTLDLVGRSDWVTVLPALVLGPDADGKSRAVAPLDEPPLYADFVTIEPSRRPLSPQAAVLLNALKVEISARTVR